MKTAALGWLSLLLFGNVLSAQDQRPPRSLLRVHSNSYQEGHGFLLSDGDLFIAVDRSVESIGSLAQTGNPLPPPWLHQRQIAIGSAKDFASLTAVLAENRVGQQTGVCSVTSVALPSAYGTTEVTWYSREARKSVFAIEVNGSTPPCPPEVLNLVSGIRAYTVAAGILLSSTSP